MEREAFQRDFATKTTRKRRSKWCAHHALRPSISEICQSKSPLRMNPSTMSRSNGYQPLLRPSKPNSRSWAWFFRPYACRQQLLLLSLLVAKQGWLPIKGGLSLTHCHQNHRPFQCGLPCPISSQYCSSISCSDNLPHKLPEVLHDIRGYYRSSRSSPLPLSGLTLLEAYGHRCSNRTPYYRLGVLSAQAFPGVSISFSKSFTTSFRY